MNAWLIRLVCLGCGVVLALPPAWCCYASQRSAAPEAKPAHACCCQKTEAPKPAPPCPSPPAHCPWYDHHTVAPSGSEKFSASPALPAPLALAVIDTPRTGP